MCQEYKLDQDDIEACNMLYDITPSVKVENILRK